MDIYKMAKEMAAINMEGKQKEWDSLWGEEEEKEYDDPFERYFPTIIVSTKVYNC